MPVRSWRLLAFAGLLLAGVACGRSSRANPTPDQTSELTPTAFVNVTVVPMSREGSLPGQTVLVRNGRIAEIGSVDRVAVPPDARHVDGSGKYLIPGLTDAHFHLQSTDDDPRLLHLLVANGVTSILNLYGTPQILDLRRRVADGDMLGPSIYTSGPYISDAPNWQPTPDDAERMVVEQKRAGYDLIKIHGDFSREAFHRLVTVAHREGLKVIGHAPRNLGIEPMFEEHMDGVAHGEEFIYAFFFFGAPDLSQADPAVRQRFLQGSEQRIPSLAEATAKSGLWVVPNLIAYKMIVAQGEDLAAVLRRPELRYLPSRLAAEWQPGRNRYDRHYPPGMAEHMRWRVALLVTLTGAFRQAGVRMMAGTDAPIPGVMPGFSLHDELTSLVAAGLTPFEAIRTATSAPAEFLGRSGDFGTVAVGARGDLLLLDADPLRDIANVARCNGVMVRGRWLPKDRLKELLAN
jgi:imidazolonepropionase-like amidohydrolase